MTGRLKRVNGSRVKLLVQSCAIGMARYDTRSPVVITPVAIVIAKQDLNQHDLPGVVLPPPNGVEISWRSGRQPGRSMSKAIGSTADPDLFDDPVMMAPVLDQLNMAAVMTVVAAPLTVIALVVAIVIVVIDSLAIVMTVDLYFAIVGRILVAVIGLDDQTGGLRRRDESCRSAERDHGSDEKGFH